MTAYIPGESRLAPLMVTAAALCLGAAGRQLGIALLLVVAGWCVQAFGGWRQ